MLIALFRSENIRGKKRRKEIKSSNEIQLIKFDSYRLESRRGGRMPLYLDMRPKMIIIVCSFLHPFYVPLVFCQPLGQWVIHPFLRAWLSCFYRISEFFFN